MPTGAMAAARVRASLLAIRIDDNGGRTHVTRTIGHAYRSERQLGGEQQREQDHRADGTATQASQQGCTGQHAAMLGDGVRVRQ